MNKTQVLKAMKPVLKAMNAAESAINIVMNQEGLDKPQAIKESLKRYKNSLRVNNTKQTKQCISYLEHLSKEVI